MTGDMQILVAYENPTAEPVSVQYDIFEAT